MARKSKYNPAVLANPDAFNAFGDAMTKRDPEARPVWAMDTGTAAYEIRVFIQRLLIVGTTKNWKQRDAIVCATAEAFLKAMREATT